MASGYDNRSHTCRRNKFGIPSGPPVLFRSNLEISLITLLGVILIGFAVVGFADSMMLK